jgi:pilus assembly protein Flp/PilA
LLVRIHRFWRTQMYRSQSGQGLAEYALILALIAIAAVLALMFLSGTIQSLLSLVGSKL